MVLFLTMSIPNCLKTKKAIGKTLIAFNKTLPKHPTSSKIIDPWKQFLKKGMLHAKPSVWQQWYIDTKKRGFRGQKPGESSFFRYINMP